MYIEERKKRKGVSGYLDFSLEKSTDFVMMKNSVKSFRVKAESKWVGWVSRSEDCEAAVAQRSYINQLHYFRLPNHAVHGRCYERGEVETSFGGASVWLCRRVTLWIVQGSDLVHRVIVLSRLRWAKGSRPLNPRPPPLSSIPPPWASDLMGNSYEFIYSLAWIRYDYWCPNM